MSDELLFQVGQFLGRVDRALLEFDHPAAERELAWDLARARRRWSTWPSTPKAPGANGSERPCSPSIRLGRRQREGLRRSVLYNDANDHNIL